MPCTCLENHAFLRNVTYKSVIALGINQNQPDNIVKHLFDLHMNIFCKAVDSMASYMKIYSLFFTNIIDSKYQDNIDYELECDLSDRTYTCILHYLKIYKW